MLSSNQIVFTERLRWQRPKYSDVINILWLAMGTGISLGVSLVIIDYLSGGWGRVLAFAIVVGGVGFVWGVIDGIISGFIGGVGVGLVFGLVFGLNGEVGIGLIGSLIFWISCWNNLWFRYWTTNCFETTRK